MADLQGIVSAHLEPGEVLRGAVPAFTDGGGRRLIIGITDRRLLMIKSSYTHFSDKGLLWADNVSAVRLSSIVHQTNVAGPGAGAFKSGNSYVTLIRADGTENRINVRRGFLFFPQSKRHLTTLFSLLAGTA